MKKSADRLTRDQQQEIAALEQLPDDQIDTNEVPGDARLVNSPAGCAVPPDQAADYPEAGCGHRRVVQAACPRRPWLSDRHQPRAAQPCAAFQRLVAYRAPDAGTASSGLAWRAPCVPAARESLRSTRSGGTPPAADRQRHGHRSLLTDQCAGTSPTTPRRVLHFRVVLENELMFLPSVVLETTRAEWRAGHERNDRRTG